MPEVIAVNPFRCRMWRGHERLEDHITEATCRTEIDSFIRHGQRLPVLGRPLRADPRHDFELVYGARRLFVACHLNVNLLLEVRELTDREAIVALDIENRQRKVVSPYERGRGYALWLRNGLFSSQDELARVLRISASQVSRLLRLAQLPPALVNAFASPLDICETWGPKLMDLWEDSQKRRRMTAVAQALARQSQRLPADVVFTRLVLAASEGCTVKALRKSEHHHEVVEDEQGKPLFRIRLQGNNIALLLSAGVAPSWVLSEIKRELADILHRARTQTADLTHQSSAQTSQQRADGKLKLKDR
jgi:ParB family chromosome partitioning protein